MILRLNTKQSATLNRESSWALNLATSISWVSWWGSPCGGTLWVLGLMVPCSVRVTSRLSTEESASFSRLCGHVSLIKDSTKSYKMTVSSPMRKFCKMHLNHIMVAALYVYLCSIIMAIKVNMLLNMSKWAQTNWRLYFRVIMIIFINNSYFAEACQNKLNISV